MSDAPRDFHSRQNLLARGALDDVIVGAGGHAQQHVLLALPHRQHHDVDISFIVFEAHLAAEGKAIHARHLPVRQNDLTLKGVQNLQSFFTARRNLNIVARGLEQLRQLCPHDLIVVDDEHATLPLRHQLLHDGGVVKRLHFSLAGRGLFKRHLGLPDRRALEYGGGRRPVFRNELYVIMHVAYPPTSLIRCVCAVYSATAAYGCREIVTVTGGGSDIEGNGRTASHLRPTECDTAGLDETTDGIEWHNILERNFGLPRGFPVTHRLGSIVDRRY